MGAANSTMIRKLQQAINSKGDKILYHTKQFYSQKQDRPVTIYCVDRAYYDKTSGRTHSTEIFSSTSQIQIVLFLRDIWYEMNGKEPPQNNEIWNRAKEAYYRKHEKTT